MLVVERGGAEDCPAGGPPTGAPTAPGPLVGALEPAEVLMDALDVREVLDTLPVHARASKAHRSPRDVAGFSGRELHCRVHDR